MTEIWLKYEKETIFRDKSKGGLLSLFLKDYKEHFGGSLIPSCKKCLNKYYINYLNLFTMSKEQKCNYKLKAKYNGIQLGTNGQPIRNGEMTDSIAKQLLTEHPHGAMLFDIIPEGVVEGLKVQSELKKEAKEIAIKSAKEKKAKISKKK